eukprot:GILI01015947.1.p1 GENE.GILI01015947.1~~GILI01015947.1.p1  ORF type:complete len:398 (+),score=26.76 GILI01015947.1:162-1355(+)
MDSAKSPPQPPSPQYSDPDYSDASERLSSFFYNPADQPTGSAPVAFKSRDMTPSRPYSLNAEAPYFGAASSRPMASSNFAPSKTPPMSQTPPLPSRTNPLPSRTPPYASSSRQGFSSKSSFAGVYDSRGRDILTSKLHAHARAHPQEEEDEGEEIEDEAADMLGEEEDDLPSSKQFEDKSRFWCCGSMTLMFLSFILGFLIFDVVKYYESCTEMQAQSAEGCEAPTVPASLRYFILLVLCALVLLSLYCTGVTKVDIDSVSEEVTIDQTKCFCIPSILKRPLRDVVCAHIEGETTTGPAGNAPLYSVILEFNENPPINLGLGHDACCVAKKFDLAKDITEYTHAVQVRKGWIDESPSVYSQFQSRNLESTPLLRQDFTSHYGSRVPKNSRSNNHRSI